MLPGIDYRGGGYSGKAQSNYCRRRPGFLGEERENYVPEPYENLKGFYDMLASLELRIKTILEIFANKDPVARWCLEVKGIGPVIAAGLVALIDIHKAPTAGHIWSYAGINPNQVWEKGQKRPWNERLKTLSWKIGQSFRFNCNKPDSPYGEIFKERKAYETENNLSGCLSDQAKEKLAKYKIGKDTIAYKWYAGCFTRKDAEKILAEPELRARGILMKELEKKPGEGIQMLPPAHIEQRAMRYATKIFLSHLHEVWYEYEFKCKPPAPFAIAILGHAHKINPIRPIIESSKYIAFDPKDDLVYPEETDKSLEDEFFTDTDS